MRWLQSRVAEGKLSRQEKARGQDDAYFEEARVAEISSAPEDERLPRWTWKKKKKC